MIDREPAVIIKLITGLESGPSSRHHWSEAGLAGFLLISIQTPLWSRRRRNKYRFHQQNKEGKAGITISVCWRIYLDYVFYLYSNFFKLLFTLYVTWKTRGRRIRSLNAINRGSANRKGEVAHKGKIFKTFVSSSSAFRYALTRRHLWGKTLLLYLSSAFWIHIPVTYLTRSQSRSTGPISPLLGAYHRASNLIAKTFDTRSPRRKCSDRCRWWLNK